MFICRLTQDLQLVRENTPVSEQETMSEEEEEEDMKEDMKKEDVKEEKEKEKKEKNTQDEQTSVILLTPVKATAINIMRRLGEGWERLRLSRLTRNNVLNTRGRSRRR